MKLGPRGIAPRHRGTGRRCSTGMDDAALIRCNIEAVRERIREAAARVGRDPTTIHLVAATKYVPVERMQRAVAAGVLVMGENRLQEALEKQTRFYRSNGSAPERSPESPPIWHFIGRVQRRKIRSIVGRFALVHSLDSLAHAEEFDRRAKEAGVRQRVLLEVNLGGEPTKGGFSPKALHGGLPQLGAFSNLDICGLMTVPPWTDDPDEARPFFRRLRELADEIMQTGWMRIHLDELSMGMSRDYDVAVEEGATLVRIGTAIFGDRRSP